MIMIHRILVPLVLVFATSLAAADQSTGPREEATSLKTEDGVTLSARWTVPASAPKGVMVLLQGSGNVAMDGDVSSPFVGFPYKGKPAKLNEQLATTLASHGIASLRFSKRGVEDAAQLKNQTLPYLVSDAKAALALAKARFPGVKAGYVGFSEGSIVAVVAAAESAVDVLFLLAPISRSLEQVMAYQFVQWPVELLKKRLDVSPSDDELSTEEQKTLAAPPLLGLLWPAERASWQALDVDRNGSLSFAREIVPTYQSFFSDVRGLLQSPAFAGWYNSFRDMTPFTTYAARVTAPVYMYQALEDSQIDWSWITVDRYAFAGRTKLQYFGGLGHCFSPFDGKAGEIKTSGPYDDSLLTALGGDIDSAF